MMTDEFIRTEDLYQIPTYAKIPVTLVRGQGSYVWDAAGNRYLDYYGGHCVTLLGHCPAPVVQAIERQARTLLFYSNVVYSDVRGRAAQMLGELAPEGLRHVFFCNSGTEANETALKLARKSSGRGTVIATEGGFHGRTLGSLAVTWRPAYRAPYVDALSETVFVPFGDAAAVRSVLETRDDVAAVIVEPIQSMAGIVEAPPAYFQTLRRVCDDHDVALIYDEIQTGVGRTGTFSISEQLGAVPDMITLAKGLGSGIPVGAVLVSDRLAASVSLGDQGTTFGGGMVAMAAMEATLTTLLSEALMDRATAVFERVRKGIEAHGLQARGRGCLIGVPLQEPAGPILTALRAEGVLAGGADDLHVIRLMPPINTTDEEIDEFVQAFDRVLKTVPVH